jgi:hypothetical protein
MTALKRNTIRLNDWLRDNNHILTLLSILAIIVSVVFFVAQREATLNKHSDDIHYLQNDMWEIYARHGDIPPSIKEQYSKMVSRGTNNAQTLNAK